MVILFCWGTFLIFFLRSLPRKHSTAHHSTRTIGKASTRRSERDNADKQTELARARMLSSTYNTARCVYKTNEEIEICSAYKNIAGGVMREGFACTMLFPSFLFRPYMRRPGCFLGTMELLAFASR